MPRIFALITLLLVVAAPAAAQTGGTEAGGAVAPTGGHVATVTDGRFTLAARADTVLGRTVHFRGTVPAEEAGRALTVERFEPKTSTWQAEATTTVGKDGRFLARWRTDHIGRFRLRATVDNAGAQAAAASPELSMTVYKPAKATWYGPGFYGRKTACGLRMSKTLVGVAHRSLPCGTNVAVYYAPTHRTMTVPVVDRGPYANGSHWDLTYAAATALGFLHTDTLNAVRLREPQPSK
jgi:hypothetical protein